ncbi:MAG TPA: RDD family protein [Xanthobacteraceae bacterium]|nr:RDD family protein [Xanthobacteraceae bacterium]
MTDTHDPASSPVDDGPRYGRFLRRFQAAIIDFMVILVALFGAVFIAITLNSENLARTLGFSIAIGWLLYEPLLVALTGSTVGHYLCNLRVVDNKTGGNINFFKAVLRTLLKAVLGWLSFVTMATTLRHQAIHDLATNSTVQIRNAAQASPHHYNHEQTELSSPAMPSGRRLLVTGLYLIAVTTVFVAFGLAIEDQFSSACLIDDRCTRGEEIALSAMGLSWVVVLVVAIILGWRGHLPGARKTRQATSPQQA